MQATFSLLSFVTPVMAASLARFTLTLSDLCKVDAEQRKELAKRGEEKTQTSDARFDAQFAFGHGLTGKEAKVRQ